MEAVPRLPMLRFELKVSDPVQFGPYLKQYIECVYNEDPESYNVEIANLESLRGAAMHPTVDVTGCQLLKKYYCQLHFLKSRFPLEVQESPISFAWRDTYAHLPSATSDVKFELMCVLYNIGALHSQLGASDARTSPDGMKMACTHFQCAAWAFQTTKETYFQVVPYTSSILTVTFMQKVCLAQAQECILEKSMLDNRKATIIAKVAVQVVDFYRASLDLLNTKQDDGKVADYLGPKNSRDWTKYLTFKVAYHKCIALLFQGQQAEELQKMGERVAFYQAASEQLEEARKMATNVRPQHKEMAEAIAFTTDVVEGKLKAAKNENEFIYHEEVPERNALQEVKGASLVKGIPFDVADPEVSGADIFARLVPMEAHEASSQYSEKKAGLLRQMGARVDSCDQSLAEFMSSLQLDVLTLMRQATGLPQEIVDRAAALSARPHATQELVSSMGKLSNSYHDVEGMLSDIQALLREEEKAEREYQELMGKRPPGIIATDLAREAAKYTEAHNKANDSNQNLHKAMTTHVANLKILARPLMELQQQIPCVALPDPNVDEGAIKELETLVAKVEEMRSQRSMLWAQLRDAVHKDDITGVLVTRQPEQDLEGLFQGQLDKHKGLMQLIEQNTAAQENILRAFVDAYARSTITRRYLQDVITKRTTTITALLTSFDTYEDLLAKANKGIEFYSKLETNVSKLLQRIKSASKVQQEERDQILLKNAPAVKPTPDEVVLQAPHPLPTNPNSAPKLKDYLDTRKKAPRNFDPYYQQEQVWPPAVRPNPVGSEFNNDPVAKGTDMIYAHEQYPVKPTYDANVEQNLTERFSSLRVAPKVDYYSQYTPYTPPSYSYQPASTSYQPAHNSYQPASNSYQPVNNSYQPASSNYQPASNNYQPVNSTYQPASNSYQPVDNTYQPVAPTAAKAYTNTTDTYQPISSVTPPQYPMSSSNETNTYTPNPTELTAYNNSYTQSNESEPVYPPVNASYSNPDLNPYAYYQNNVYYPAGYGPQISTQTPQAYYPETPMSYTGGEYGTSVTNLNQSTYSTPALDLKSSNSGTSLNYETPEYQGYYSGGTYAAPTKESNVDLLTGLDFTITQPPLIPQQQQVAAAVVPPPEEPKVKAPVAAAAAPPKPRIINRKPLLSNEVKKLFTLEIEKFEKTVDDLSSKTLSGGTNLDLKWKEVVDKQEGAEKKVISVARCYPMKNRFADILPYDYSRVVLESAPDDYINASHVKGVSFYAPPFIVTQAPLPGTLGDFWAMVCEQHVELIVCLQGNSEMGSEAYWPVEKGRDLVVAGLVVGLVGVTVKGDWVERLVSVAVPEKRESRMIMHLQFTGWPASLFPTKPDAFVSFVSEVGALFLQQRNTAHPVVVQCCSGIGRSGVASLVLCAIMEVSSSCAALPDLVGLAVKLGGARKNVLRDREHLKFAYEVFLGYMKQVIGRGPGLVENRKVTEMGAIEVKPEDDDPLSSLDPFWASKK